MFTMIKAYAEAVTVGTQSRARGRQGESMGQFYRRTGSAFGQRITSVNRSSVNNVRRTTNR